MTFYEVYKSYPFGVAGLMANYASCKLCTAKKCGQCDRNKTEYEECFRNWEEYLGKKPDKLDGIDSMATFLCQVITCCEKCPVKEENKCNGRCIDSFRLWLNSEINQKPENEEMQGLKAEDVKTVKRILEVKRIPEEHDAVNHPNHYQLVDGIEVIDVIKVILNRSNFTGLQGYYLGNVLKYVLRADMGTRLFDTFIRENVAVEQSQAMQTSLFDFAPRSNAAQDYESLFREMELI